MDKKKGIFAATYLAVASVWLGGHFGPGFATGVFSVQYYEKYGWFGLLMPLLAYLIGRLLGLSEPKKRAISIEVGMQNSGLASSLATIHFAAYPMATIPGAIFSVWHNISGAMVARLYNILDSSRAER